MNYHWSHSYRQAQFIIYDARIGVFLLAILMHIRLWTVLIGVAVLIGGIYLKRKNMSLASVGRLFRSFLVGKYRPSQQPRKIRRKLDLQATPMAWDDIKESVPHKLTPLQNTPYKKR